MATPLITGNQNAQRYLSKQYYTHRAFSPFFWEARVSKKEAHAIAWAKMRVAMERERAMRR